MLGKKYVVLGHESTQKGAGSEAAISSAAAELVLIVGKEAGGPDQLAGGLVDVLVECERRGTASVLLAGAADDLDTPVAAVCRYVVTDQPDVGEEARRRFGAERVRVVASVGTDQIKAWISELLAAAGRPAPIRARLGGRGDRIMPMRALYGKIRGRNTRSRGAGRETSQTPD
ncbi:hypothetical protein [Phytoactinopolyspora mesophila]|uniref:Uncharacterized protein n=1 Tax=Phytoactinopolyspora mesophila TaxID=2650750 RepID=A0A7K3M2D5_9ACTN|nr:hypothetical protein [Phytoactinopolyspora mesophila]NDL57429.1 hypothetical protein [Phytoactinopolyspora mesophila]